MPIKDLQNAQSLFQQGLALHQQGRLDEAKGYYSKALAIQPNHADSLHLLGVIAYQNNKSQQAVEYINDAIAIIPNRAVYYNNCGNALVNLKRLDDALASYDKAIAIKPDYADAYYNRGNALKDLKKPDGALANYYKAIAIIPDYAEAYYNCGVILQDLKRLDDALSSYDQAIALNPADAVAYYNRGVTLCDLKRFEEALASYDHATAIKPDYSTAYNNCGNLLRSLKRPDDALANYDKAIAIKPDYAEAHNNRGVTQYELMLLDDALASYDKAIAIEPDYADAHNNRGNTLKDLKRSDDALASYDKAIAIKPDYAEAFYNRGVTLQDLKRFDDALANYVKAIAIKPDQKYLFGNFLFTQMKLCEWDDLDCSLTELINKIQSGYKITTPFPLLSLVDSPELHKLATEIYVKAEFPGSDTLGNIEKRSKRDRIKIGYYSADFYNHATAHLMAELFETHDAAKFELFGFSFGSDNKDEMSQRLCSAFKKFIDVRGTSDGDVARLSRELGIDIAIDLKGFTQGARTNIFAERCAPIQVNYLGYPGSMGADYIDYIIADKILIPEGSSRHYSEKIIYLPDSYQVNDTKREISDRVYTREELGLPATGFVFCCFNNNYKILPATFDVWMRILIAVQGSVLWLFEDNPTAVKNLRKESEKRGVDGSRLVFANYMPLSEHLARHRLADLFIDTFPCNAHTTASDALWAGLPILTLMGQSFASRVSASLLSAIELPELITKTQEAYESLAIELALNSERLHQLKDRLAANRLTTPLFDIKLFTKNMENAYSTMYERYHADLQIAPTSKETEQLATMLNQCRYSEAESLARAMTENFPGHGIGWKALGVVLKLRGLTAESLKPMQKAAETMPANGEAHYNLAVTLNDLCHFEEAEASYRRALGINPDYANAHCGLGNVLKDLGRLEEAGASYRRALVIKPDFAEAYYNIGATLNDRRFLEDAEASYRKALVIRPDFAEAHYNLGIILNDLGRFEEAEIANRCALKIIPDYVEAHCNLGSALKDLGRLEEAEASYRRALLIKPDFVEVHCNLGFTLNDMRHLGEAEEHCCRALVIKPDFAEAHSNLGMTLQNLNRLDEALTSYDKAIAIKPNYAEALYNRGVALQGLKRFDDALASYIQANTLKPDYKCLLGIILHTQMKLCEWDDLDCSLTELINKIQSGYKITTPFPLLSLVDSPELHKLATEIYVKAEFPGSDTLGNIEKRSKRDRIKIGYYSADFYNHATAYLMAELFETHDAAKFELFGFSFGSDNKDEMSQRLCSAFKKFIDVRGTSDRDVARLSRELGIDIAIDLKGFTQGARTNIFAERCAPIQVNYLGYPGSMGADYIDYIIADKILIPEGSSRHYSEKIIYLPDCYQVNDTKREISDRVYTREELGLPATGFVFCCFNNNYKILPATFDVWMRILMAVEGSVLWLFEDNPTAVKNLRKEAKKRGVDGSRLVFANYMPLSEHLARHRLADLFIDTFPCNAHTTASDALWAGLPILTLMGQSFASRVSASLLSAIELPELITKTQEAYESLAIELALNTERLLQLKARLAAKRLTTPLFDIKLFTKNIENAYSTMYERYHSDLPLEHIYVGQEGATVTRKLDAHKRQGLENRMVQNNMRWDASFIVKELVIVRICPDNYLHYHVFDEIIESLVVGFTDNGIAATVVNNEFSTHLLNIVIGAHMLNDEQLGRLPENIIIYNFEQFDSNSTWMRTSYLDALASHRCWDYSQYNTTALKMLRPSAEPEYVPVGYAATLTRLLPLTQDIDVLFYGSINTRREAIIDALKSAGCNVHVSFGVYGEERDNLIRRSKVVLNIHYYESHVLEIVRVSYLMANSKAIVSECSSDTEVYPHLLDGLRLVPYDCIVDGCIELLANPDKRRDLEQRALLAVKKQTSSEVLMNTSIFSNKLADSLPMEPVPKRLNLGSGKDWRQDFLNIDILPRTNPDLVLDICHPLPLGEMLVTERFAPFQLSPGQFDLIIAYDVLEHLPDLVAAMTSCLNLLSLGGEMHVQVPYDLSYGAWQDPTHLRAFNERSWLYYTDWHWYLGWQNERFVLDKQEFVLSATGTVLMEQGTDITDILRTPRAVDLLKVVLRKIRIG